MIVRVSSIVVLCVLAAACSSNEPDAVPISDAALSTETTSLDVDADVTLDSVSVGGDVMTFAPSGWEFDDDGTAVPPSRAGLSPATRWRIDDECAAKGCGPMSAADWSALVADVDFATMIDQPGSTPTRDESGSTRRLVQTEDSSGVVNVLIARWVDGASSYLRCELTGDKAELADLVPAFEFACDNTRAALDG